MSEGDGAAGDGVGTVYLVGSGPGDPDLLTVRAAKLIELADVVLHDKLPGPDPRTDSGGEARRRGEAPAASGPRRSTRPAAGRTGARAGKSVVRLKGGDPFVFGRGGEEAEHLAEAGIPFDRSRRHLRDRGSRGRRNSGDAPRPRLLRLLRHGPRRPDEGGVGGRLGRGTRSRPPAASSSC